MDVEDTGARNRISERNKTLILPLKTTRGGMLFGKMSGLAGFGEGASLYVKK